MEDSIIGVFGITKRAAILANEFLNIPAWGWAITLGFYLVGNAIYHAWHHLFPYTNTRRWLAVIDLFVLTTLEVIHIMPQGVLVALRYLQVACVGVANLPPSPNSSSPFWWCYWSSMAVACGISSFTENSGHWSLAIAATLAQGGIAVACYLVLVHYSHYLLSLAGEVAEEKLVCLTRYRLRQHETIVDTSSGAILDHLCRYQKITQRLYEQASRQAQPGNRPTHDVIQALDARVALLVAMSQRIALPSDSQDLEDIQVKQLLPQYFTEALLLSPFPPIENAAFVSPQLQISWMDDVPAVLPIRGFLWWRFIIASWLDYFLSWGQMRHLTVSVSQYENNYTLKGIAQIGALESKQQGESNKCPQCLRGVRNLYEISGLSVKSACRECLRTHAEKKLQEDWQILVASSPSPPNLWWLARALLLHFPLGYIHCGITNWEQWEYFITLTIHK